MLRSALALAVIAAATSGAASAADAPAPPRRRGHTYYIAPGSPATVGQGGAVVGVVPNKAIPAPRGSMATFGGLLGTGAPRAPVAGSTAPAPPR